MNKCYISPKATVVRLHTPLLFSQSKEIVIPAGAKATNEFAIENKESNETDFWK